MTLDPPYYANAAQKGTDIACERLVGTSVLDQTLIGEEEVTHCALRRSRGPRSSVWHLGGMDCRRALASSRAIASTLAAVRV